MKQLISRTVALVLLCLCSLCGYVGADQATFTPSDDAYVYEHLPDVNYGTAQELSVAAIKDVTYPIIYGKVSYLKFNLTSLPNDIVVTTATLYLRWLGGFNCSGTFGIGLNATGDGWSETTIVWSNAPGAGPSLGFHVVDIPYCNGPDDHYIDLDPDNVTAAISDNKILSIVIGTNWNALLDGSAERGFASKDHYNSSYRPRLDITYVGVPPTAPSNCTASDGMCDEVRVCWQDNSSNEDGFKIYREGIYIALVGPDVTCYDDHMASPGVTYLYCVTAYNQHGESGPSCDAGTRLSTPSAPTSCVASDILCDKVHFCWQDNSNNEDGFRIYRDGALIGSVGVGGTCYDDNTASPGGSYMYCVKAYNSCGESGQCCDSGTRLAPPVAPSNCSASDSLCDKVCLYWQHNSSNEDEFKILRDGVHLATVGANVTSYEDTSGLPGQIYNYCVKACNDCGESDHCCDDGIRSIPPAAPSGCVASDSLCSHVEITWQDNSVDERGFRVYRNNSRLDSVGVNVTAYSDQSTSPGVTYSYFVKAHSGCGESDASNSDDGRRLSSPASPANVTAECMGGYVYVCWDDLSEESGYYVYRNDLLYDSVGTDVSCYDDHDPAIGELCYQISAHNICGESPLSELACETFPCDTCEHPVCFDVVDPTGESYSIVIDSSLWDGQQLQNCDEIGVFADTGGGLLCVGAAVYHRLDLPIPLVAWEDDPLTIERDGFTVGDTMHFMVCRPSAGMVERACAHYNLGNGLFGSGVYSQLWLESPCIECDTIPLYPGWQWISTSIDPHPCEMENIFADCWTGHVNIIVAGDGSFCIPGIGCWIDCWDGCGAYRVHSADACTIEICGSRVPAEKPCTLSVGWNWIAYFPRCPLEPEFALASIWDCLDILIGDDGSFCIPGVGCWIDCMEYNKGYKVHLRCPDILIYPTDCPPCPPPFAKTNSHVAFVKATHFSYSGNTGESYSVVVNTIDLNDQLPEVGDEVGVFTSSGLCVGAGVWEGDIVGIVAWRDDDQTELVDGFQAGEEMIFKFWDRSKNKEVELSASFEGGDGRFGTDAYALANLKGVSSELPKRFELAQNYPNPFNPETKISYALPKDCHVRLTVCNLLGRSIKVLVDRHQTSGRKSITWDGKDDEGRDVSSGVYFYRLQADEFTEARKMVILK